MNYANGLLPDYSTFTIDDFEQGYDALSAVVTTAANFLCQPRMALADGQTSAGGALLEAVTVEPNLKRLDDLVAALRVKVFTDFDADRRRRLILIRHEAEYGEGDLSAIVMLADVHGENAVAA